MGVWKLLKQRHNGSSNVDSVFLNSVFKEYDFLSEERNRLPTLFGVVYDGWILYGLLQFLGSVAGAVGFRKVSGISKFLSYFSLAFFRNFKRAVPVAGKDADGDVILSPADGKVIAVEKVFDDYVGEAWRVKIFMSIFDCHVNRSVANAVLEKKVYRPGKFHAAYLKEADVNERLESCWRLENGEKVKIAQVAGQIARRIDFRVEEGERVGVSEVFGMIKFSSRVDVVVSRRYRVLCKISDTVRAGDTILFRLV